MNEPKAKKNFHIGLHIELGRRALIRYDMQLVACGLVFDVEEPIFDRQPDASKSMLPLPAQSAAGGVWQEVQSLRSRPIQKSSEPLDPNPLL